MHAQTTATTAARPRPSLTIAGNVAAGQVFMRLTSRSEVLARLSFADHPAQDDSDAVWAVVLNVNSDSAGFVPGQLIKLRGTEHVRCLQEVQPAQYVVAE